MRDAEEALRQRWKELDDKKSLLKAAELAESESDQVSLVKMIDQLCTPGKRLEKTTIPVIKANDR
mgnify:CR=1 FL=1